MQQPQGLNGTTVFAVENLPIARVDGEYFGYKRRLPVTVSLRVEHVDRPAVTVDHERFTSYLEFAITMAVWQPRRGDICYSTPGFIDGAFELVDLKLSESAISKLAMLAEFHLNSLKAACRHQQPQVDALRAEGNKGSLLDEVDYCEEGDYRYGSAWLLSPLPAGLIEALREIFADADTDYVYDSAKGE